jgi:hypothetical protein
MNIVSLVLETLYNSYADKRNTQTTKKLRSNNEQLWI